MIDELGFLEDLRWALLMAKARAHRRTLLFSQRKQFDDAFRHVFERNIIAYPDAFYHATDGDFLRAYRATKTEGEA